MKEGPKEKRRDALAALASDRLTLLYWIAKAVDMWGREGFEEGQTAEEVRYELRSVLRNFGYPYPPEPGDGRDPTAALLRRAPAYGPADVARPGDFDLKKAVHAYEALMIEEALRRSGGLVAQAAEHLGMTHQTLCSALATRHRDLAHLRSSVRPRPSVWGNARRKREREAGRHADTDTGR